MTSPNHPGVALDWTYFFPPGASRLSPTERSRVVGIGMSYLLLRPEDWVHRRVERVVFVDDVTVRRQTSVDFSYPGSNGLVKRMLELDPEQALVPLTMLRKEKLAHFSVRDEDGRALPVLNTTQNGSVATSTLVGMARTVLRRSKERLPAEVSQSLELVAARPTDMSWFVFYVLRRLRAVSDVGQATRHVEEVINLFDARADLADAVRALPPHHGRIGLLMDNDPFTRLLSELATQFVMLVPVPAVELERRRVFKFGYDQTLRFRTEQSMSRRLAVTALESCGYRPRAYRFENIAPGHAESMHVEMAAPEGVEIARAGLLAQDPDTPEETNEDTVGFASELVHLQLRGVARDWPGTAFVSFQAARAGLLLAAPTLAFFIALVLYLGKDRTGDIERDAGAALLLAVPTAFAAFLARPGEHALSTQLLRGVRLLVLGAGLCSFVAAGGLAGGWKGDDLSAVWTGAWIASLVFFTLLTVSYALTLLRGRSTNARSVRKEGYP